MKGLTEKQRHILDFIQDFTREQGMSPTVYEIGEHFGVTAPTVFMHLKSLAKKNFISRNSKARSVVVSDSYGRFRRTSNPKIVEIPVFERLPAGPPNSMSSRIFMDVKAFAAGDKASYFALKVTGDSMREAGILDGDIAIFRNSTEASRNNIVAGTAGGRSVLGFYSSMEHDAVELRFASPSFESQFYAASKFVIHGVLVGIQRFY